MSEELAKAIDYLNTEYDKLTKAKTNTGTKLESLEEQINQIAEVRASLIKLQER